MDRVYLTENGFLCETFDAFYVSVAQIVMLRWESMVGVIGKLKITRHATGFVYAVLHLVGVRGSGPSIFSLLRLRRSSLHRVQVNMQ